MRSRSKKAPTIPKRAVAVVFRHVEVKNGKVTSSRRLRSQPSAKPTFIPLPRNPNTSAKEQDDWSRFDLLGGAMTDKELAELFGGMDTTWEQVEPDNIEETGGSTVSFSVNSYISEHYGAYNMISLAIQPNQHLRSWREHQAAGYLAEPFRHSSRPLLHVCSTCTNAPSRLFRCNSCLGCQPRCSACLVDSHRLLPTHHISVWRGNFWDDYSLAKLGLVVHLNHSLDTCVSAVSTSSVWVGDVLGFSRVNVCYAPITGDNTRGAQLLRFGLFPCSDINPQSAFTMAALEHFSLFGTLGKNSTHKYYSVLERLTNTGFPEDVPDRYRELALTHRKYCHLMSVKRSGSSYPEHPDPRFRDNLSLQCVACPHPGVNFKLCEIIDDGER